MKSVSNNTPVAWATIGFMPIHPAAASKKETKSLDSNIEVAKLLKESFGTMLVGNFRNRIERAIGIARARVKTISEDADVGQEPSNSLFPFILSLKLLRGKRRN